MKRTITIALLVVSMLMLSIAVTQAQNELTVGLSVPSAEAVYYNAITQAELDGMDNVTINVMDAAYDAETELANVAEMLDAGLDALMLIPVDAEASVATVQAANEAGVPVFLMITPLSYDAEEVTVELAGEFYIDVEAAAGLATEYVCALIEDDGNVLNVTNAMPEDMAMSGEMDMSNDMDLDSNTAMDDDMMLDDEDMELTPAQTMSMALATAMADSCSGATLTQSVIVDVTGDDLFDAISDALAADSFDVLIGYNSDVITEAVNAKFPANRGLNVVSFVYSDDVEFFLGVGDVNAAILPDPAGFLQDSLTAAMSILNGEEMAEAFTLTPYVLDSDLFATTRCSGPC